MPPAPVSRTGGRDRRGAHSINADDDPLSDFQSGLGSAARRHRRQGGLNLQASPQRRRTRRHRFRFRDSVRRSARAAYPPTRAAISAQCRRAPPATPPLRWPPKRRAHRSPRRRVRYRSAPPPSAALPEPAERLGGRSPPAISRESMQVQGETCRRGEAQTRHEQCRELQGEASSAVPK